MKLLNRCICPNLHTAARSSRVFPGLYCLFFCLTDASQIVDNDAMERNRLVCTLLIFSPSMFPFCFHMLFASCAISRSRMQHHLPTEDLPVPSEDMWLVSSCLHMLDGSATQVSHQGFPVVTDSLFFPPLLLPHSSFMYSIHFQKKYLASVYMYSTFLSFRQLAKTRLFPPQHNRWVNNIWTNVSLNKDSALISLWHLLTLQCSLELKNACSFAPSLIPLWKHFSIKGPLSKPREGKNEPWAPNLRAQEELHC